jgi:hypothetical protein
MAIQARRAVATSRPLAPSVPRVYASAPIRERLGNMAPFTLSVGLVSLLFWGPFHVPWLLAGAIVAFFAYWLVRSWAVAISCWIGLRRIEAWKRTDWPRRYARLRASAPPHARPPHWAWPRHMVIIPNYKESEEGLARTLGSLAAQANAHQLVVVMAMEDREPGARDKARRLVERFAPSFDEMFATFHPAGLPRETPGKGSNEAWAAREAHRRLVEGAGLDLDRFTVTSCDADAVFHPHHFEALNYLFLTAPDRYRTFWQPTIFNSNNIWDIPAPLRIPDGLSGINRLSNLVMPGSVRFPTSCYSLSWKMLTEVDYWDEEVIPEDWHLYLKCSFALGDRVQVDALYLPLGNDCVLADGYWQTLKAHYAQSVRHAWGASDIPYAWRAYLSGESPVSRRRGFLLAGAVTKVHVLWMAQWYIVTMGSHMPVFLTDYFGGRMPHWWLARPDYFRLPGPNWNLADIVRGDFSDPVGPWLWLSISNLLIYFCLFPLIAMIIFEMKVRPPRPADVPRRAVVASFAMWPLMAVITFFFASLPALHAQWKLASGRGLVYRVAEKGSRRPAVALPAPVAHAAAVAEPVQEPVGAVGGGS